MPSAAKETDGGVEILNRFSRFLSPNVRERRTVEVTFIRVSMYPLPKCGRTVNGYHTVKHLNLAVTLC